MSKQEKLTTVVLVILAAVIFAIGFYDPDQPAPAAEQTDELEYYRTSISEECTTSPTPTDAITIAYVEYIPTAVLTSPTAEVTPEPTATPTQAPTPKAAGYTRGKPGTYLAETNGKHAFKPWTSWRCYNIKASAQYRLQQIAKTDENGLRTVTDSEGVERYCIALGTSWAGGTEHDIGRCVDVKMENGEVLHCVLADVKKVEHSQNYEGRYGGNGELLEFIVDQTTLNAAVKRSGNVGSLGGAFEGEGSAVIVYDAFIGGFGG